MKLLILEDCGSRYGPGALMRFVVLPSGGIVITFYVIGENYGVC